MGKITLVLELFSTFSVILSFLEARHLRHAKMIKQMTNKLQMTNPNDNKMTIKTYKNDRTMTKYSKGFPGSAVLGNLAPYQSY
jgi:hypothetical protein